MAGWCPVGPRENEKETRNGEKFFSSEKKKEKKRRKKYSPSPFENNLRSGDQFLMNVLSAFYQGNCVFAFTYILFQG